MTGQRKVNLAALAMTALLLAAGSAQGATLFQAVLSGANEVPPNAVPQTGTVSLILNDAQTEASYVIEYDELPNETGAHFHQAPPGANGPVVHGLPAGNPKVGVWLIDPEHVQALFAGEIYVNIHTSDFPGGAIRANLLDSVVQVEVMTWDRLKALFR